MKLAIISHTEHYISKTGVIVGWGPTINELNHLLEVFEEIYHIAMLHEGEAPASALPYASGKIKLVAIPTVGGRTIGSKFKTLWEAPKTLAIVSKTLKKVDYFHLRTPTGIGVFLIPYLTLFTKKEGWFKYAGNWNQDNPPLGYKLQRLMLKKQSRKVTINGRWLMQSKHCLTFENPCLELKDIIEGETINELKTLGDKLSFCFVGRLEREKGVEIIIKSFSKLSLFQKTKIGKIHMIGNGKNSVYFENLAKLSGVHFIFHGFLPREEVFKIYKETHFFMLPSVASEGFPKVIAEAMNFGSIPIVSNVSSIGQYIKDGINGFVIADVNVENFTKKIQQILMIDNTKRKKILNERRKLVNKFTFNHYNKRIRTEIMGLSED